MTNSANGIQRKIKLKREKLGTVTSFKYLGAIVSDEGSDPEVLSRTAKPNCSFDEAEASIERKQRMSSKLTLMRSLDISIFLYACVPWTLTAALEKRVQAFRR